MINNVINIDVDFEAMGSEKSPRQTTLTTYILDGKNIELSMAKKRPAVIVCPGGGYNMTSCREAEPIALRYCAAGFHAFVLDYSVAPARYPAAICELSKAVKYVKDIADENNIDKDNIFVIGFSAGGHLATSLAVHFDRPEVKKFAEIQPGENKPKGVLLSYPVITVKEGIRHDGTIQNFCGGNDDYLSLAGLENHVSENTPPCFLWHTFEDGAVPVQNSILFASALKEKNVPFELHIFPKGSHGLSLADKMTCEKESWVIPEIQKWMDMSIDWIENMCK